MLKLPYFSPGAMVRLVAAPRITTLTLRRFAACVQLGGRCVELAGARFPVTMIHSEDAAGETHQVGWIGLN
jgi:hypothetical protein